MGALITAGVPQYYGVAAAPWGVYPANLIPQQQSQPRRPLTPSQQGAENQPYQVSDTDRYTMSYVRSYDATITEHVAPHPLNSLNPRRV